MSRIARVVVLVLAAFMVKCSARGGGGGGSARGGGGARRRSHARRLQPTFDCCCGKGFKYQNGWCTTCQEDDECPENIAIPGTRSKSPSCGMHQHKCRTPDSFSPGCSVTVLDLVGFGVICLVAGATMLGKGKTKAEFTEKAQSCSAMSHPLVQTNCADLGSEYRISWICDNCNRKFMRSTQPNLLHCRTCKTDFCGECKPVDCAIQPNVRSRQLCNPFYC